MQISSGLISSLPISITASFAAFLPPTGTAVRQIALEDWGSDWLVLRLHNPFEYQLGSLETGFRAVRIEHFIVRSRWAGHPIGSHSTSVFVLLDIDQLLDTKELFRSADFLHVTWALISHVDSSPQTPNHAMEPTADRSDEQPLARARVCAGTNQETDRTSLTSLRVYKSKPSLPWLASCNFFSEVRLPALP
jgi:hypothetical protein